MAKKVTEEKKMNSKACETCNCTCGGRWATLGWVLLLAGGLSHMLPTQMAPLLAWNLWGVTLQMIVGVVSVILALYYLLGE